MVNSRSSQRTFTWSVAGAAGLALGAALAAAPGLAAAAPAVDTTGRVTGATTAVLDAPHLTTTATATISASQLQINARPPIAFTPFPMVDPTTMVDPRTHQPLTPRPIAATASLTLPNGRVVNAGTYYTQLNNLEQWLSQHGYSLHNTPNNSEVELARLPVNTTLLEQQLHAGPQPTSLQRRTDFAVQAAAPAAALHLDATAAAAQGVHTTLSAAQISTINSQVTAAGIHSQTVDGLDVSPDALAAIGKLHLPVDGGIIVQPQSYSPISDSRSWGWNAGGSGDSFNAYLNGSLSISGEACKPADMSNFYANNSSFNVQANGAAGGHVFSAGGDLLRIAGDLKGTESNNQITATLNVWLAGQTVYNLNKTSPTWTESNNFSKAIDFSAETTVFVGPIPLDLKIGAQGSAGLNYSMNLTPLSVSISGGPTVTANVYAQAGVDVVVASAGVRANLTLVNWNMDFGADAGLGWLLGFYVYDDVYAYSKLNMLSGNVSAYASVSYPCFNWPPWCTSNYSDTLFSWSGLNFDSVLFNDRNIYPLHW